MLKFTAGRQVFAAAGNGVSAPPGPRPPPGITLPTTGSVLDEEALRRLSELDPTGANHLLERVFQAFEASALRLLPQMHEALRKADYPGVRHVVHTLKSSSASIGALALSGLCADIERLLRSGDSAGAVPVIEQFHVEVHRVDAAVGQTLQHLEAAAQ